LERGLKRFADDDTDEWGGAPRKASSGAYWSKRWRTDRRLYISGSFSADLAPLPDRVAPALAMLPALIQRPVVTEFYSHLPQGFGDPCSWRQRAVAHDWIRGAVAKFTEAHLDIAYDFEEIEGRARRNAEICEHIPTLPGIAAYCRAHGIEAPEPSPPDTAGRLTVAGCIARTRDPRWWRRALTKYYRRRAEETLRGTGFVRRQRSLYASRFAVQAHGAGERATRDYLKARVIDNGSVQLNLWDVHQRSIANPAIRRAELMTRMSGFERIARESGHVAEFITLTTPSKFHAYLSTGAPNPAYEGASVRDAQAWLSKMWTRSRSKLKRLSMLVYGFRVAEPHHDGTPHWHMVLFTNESDRGTLRAVLRGHWLSECGSEPGAAHHRIEFKSIDYAQGSATGYLSKYIAKNIDGFEVGEDFEADTAIDGSRSMLEPSAAADAPKPNAATITVARVRAWASLHGIRQFQQIGGPQVTIYRELRRLQRHGSEGQPRPLIDVASIERARVPADAGDWSGYVTAIGGIEAGRKGSLSLWTEITGECNHYSEAKGPQIRGVLGPGGGAITRFDHWRVEKRAVTAPFFDRGPVQLLPRVQGESGPGLSEPRGWTNPQETSTYGPAI
jgi:Bacteriophage replication gene A protein (GPA)